MFPLFCISNQSRDAFKVWFADKVNLPLLFSTVILEFADVGLLVIFGLVGENMVLRQILFCSEKERTD